MAELSFEEFMKLIEEDKCIRYKDMNDNDKLRARVTQDWGKPQFVGK